MQHPAFNPQHAQMLLARGLIGAVPHHHPPMYRPPTNGLFQGLDHGPLPPGAAARVRAPHPGMHGSVIRQPGGGQIIPASSASYQPPQQVNGLSAAVAASQTRSSGGHSSRKEDKLHRIPHIAAQASSLPEAAHSRVDISSAKGIFGWTSIDGVDIPFLLRDDKKYLAVRMVEMKLLSKYPSTYPDELKHRPPLMSHYITENEAKILNEINKHHCAGEYGHALFVTQDLIVKMSDFEEFYNIVKKHFPPSVLAQFPPIQNPGGSQQKKAEGGWIQINNTVVPYVFRSKARYVPLSVIRYAAGLLTDVRVEGENPKEEECSFLNESCRTAGVEFNFVRTTKLVMLDLVQRLCNNISLNELPKEDPFSQAEYQGSPDEEKHDDSAPSSGGSMSLSTNQMPYPGPSNRSGSQGSSNGPSPPSAASATSVSQTSAQGSNIPFWMNQHLGIYPGHPGGFPPGGPHIMRGPGRPPLAPGIPHQPHPHQAGPPASLANHIPNVNRPSSQGTHISPTANQFNPKSAEVNNNSFGGAQRRHSHEAVDLSRDLASPREKKDHSNPPTPSGTPLGRTLSSSSLPQATTPVPRTSSAGSGSGGIQRSTPDGSPQIPLQPGPPGLVPGIPTLNPSLQMGPDGHPVLGSLVPPGHPGWHPMMNNPAEYHKMLQIMQLQAMAQQQQHQQHQLQQQLQMLEQQHLQQQRLKQHESMSKMSRSGSRNDVPRSAATGVPQIRGRSIPSSSQSQPSPSSQQATGSRTPTPNSQQGSVNKSSLTQAVIQRVEFQGKTLSCIVKGERKEYYALVEALSRVYFPNCTLEEFQFALEKSLQVPLVKLTEDEERSFISFYNIPTKTLMCNKVIRLAEFQELIPQLKCMFRDKIPGGEKITDPGMPPRSTVLVTSQSSKDGKQSATSGEVRGSPSSSTPGTPNVHSEALGKISAAFKAYIGKRPAPSDTESTDGTDSPGPSKQPKVSLEEAVNRLKQFQAEQKSKRKSTRPERRTGSQSPTSDTPTEYQARSPESDTQNMAETEAEPIDSSQKDSDILQKLSDETTPMDVDTEEPAAPLELTTRSDQTEISATESLMDSAEGAEEVTKETILEQSMDTEILAQTEENGRPSEAIDFSAKKDGLDERTNESTDVERLSTLKDGRVDESTGEWTNTQPETAPDDLLLNSGLQHPDNTIAPAASDANMSGQESQHSEVLDLAVHSNVAQLTDVPHTLSTSDQNKMDNLLISDLSTGTSVDPSVAHESQIQISESETAASLNKYDQISKTETDNDKNAIQDSHSEVQPGIADTSLYSLTTSHKEANGMSIDIGSGNSELFKPEGDKVHSDQPADLHSAPDAQISAASGEDISQVEKTCTASVEPLESEFSSETNDAVNEISGEMTTKTASEESMLEFAEAQITSNKENSENTTYNSEKWQEPPSVSVTDSKDNAVISPNQELGMKLHSTSLDGAYNTQFDMANTAPTDGVNAKIEHETDTVLPESDTYTGLDLTTTPEGTQLKVPLVVDNNASALVLVKTSVGDQDVATVISPMGIDSDMKQNQDKITEYPNQSDNLAGALGGQVTPTNAAIDTKIPAETSEPVPGFTNHGSIITEGTPFSESKAAIESKMDTTYSQETSQISQENDPSESLSVETREMQCESVSNNEEAVTPILKEISFDTVSSTGSTEQIQQIELPLCPEIPETKPVSCNQPIVSLQSDSNIEMVTPVTPQIPALAVSDSKDQVKERLDVSNTQNVHEGENDIPVMDLFPGLGKDEESEEEDTEISNETNHQKCLSTHASQPVSEDIGGSGDAPAVEAVNESDAAQSSQTTPKPDAAHSDQTTPTPDAAHSDQATPKPDAVHSDQTTPTPDAVYSDQITPKPDAAHSDQATPKPDAVHSDQTTPKPDAAHRDQTTPKPDAAHRDQTTPKPDAAHSDQATLKPDAVHSDQTTPKPDAAHSDQTTHTCDATQSDQTTPESDATQSDQTTHENILDPPATEMTASTIQDDNAENLDQPTAQNDNDNVDDNQTTVITNVAIADNATRGIISDGATAENISDVDANQTPSMEVDSTNKDVNNAGEAAETTMLIGMDSGVNGKGQSSEEVKSIEKTDADNLANSETASMEVPVVEQTGESSVKRPDGSSEKEDQEVTILGTTSVCEEGISRPDITNFDEKDAAFTIKDEAKKVNIDVADMEDKSGPSTEIEKLPCRSESTTEGTTAVPMDDNTEISIHDTEETPMDVAITHDDTKQSTGESVPTPPDSATFTVTSNVSGIDTADISNENENQNPASDDSTKSTPLHEEPVVLVTNNITEEDKNCTSMDIANPEVQSPEVSTVSDSTPDSKSLEQSEPLLLESSLSVTEEMDVSDPDLEAKLLASPPYTFPQPRVTEPASEAVLLGLDSESTSQQAPESTVENKEGTGNVSDSTLTVEKDGPEGGLQSKLDDQMAESQERVPQSAVDFVEGKGSKCNMKKDEDNIEREEGSSVSGEGRKEIEQEPSAPAPSDSVVPEHNERENETTTTDSSKNIDMSSSKEEGKEPTTDIPKEESEVILTVTSSKEPAAEGPQNEPDIATTESPNVNITTEKESNSCL